MSIERNSNLVKVDESARVEQTLARPFGSRSPFLVYRVLVILFSQSCLVLATYYCSFLLRLDVNLDAHTSALFWKTFPLVLLVKLSMFTAFGLLRGWWRYVGISDLLDISKAALLSSVITFTLIEYVLRPVGYPRSVILIDMLLTIFALAGARFMVRAYTERARVYGKRQKALVVGAGSAGSTIVRELQQNPDLDYAPVGLVDDDLSKKGIKIHGIKVLGTTNELSDLIARHGAECVLIAIPSATGKQLEMIVEKCRESKVQFRVLPPIAELITRPASTRQLRKLRLEDLLQRDPVKLDLEQIKIQLENKVHLITGAGGSIGSELTKQIAAFGPKRLVLLERSENDLFKLGVELSTKFPKLDFIPVVGDILDVTLLREVFGNYHPDAVFHAAAYKHVPMMERNCFQAVTNNIFGTYNVALVAKQFLVDTFVLISSDKAVNPTNIMGVTKRLAEMIILGLQHGRTRFMAVRFGNVLGSNGSVLPTFEQQIAKGGPVTVTHADATRYFMTIPEAVQLVLQASSMGQGGEIFVLDMGEPIKIVELARNMIRLSGFEPDREIAVVFTGLRPGEKMFEELRLDGEGIMPTRHDKIFVLDGGSTDFGQVGTWLEELSALVERRNVHGLITKLVAIVPEYSPSKEMVTLSQVDRHDQALAYKRARLGLSSTLESVENVA